MTLETGRKYEVTSLAFSGWTKGDGSSTDGYSVEYYFAVDGSCLGPDEHDIEPVFARTKGGRR